MTKLRGDDKRSVYRERVILGPCRCRGCHRDVMYVVRPGRRMGWLHESGLFTCPAR